MLLIRGALPPAICAAWLMACDRLDFVDVLRVVIASPVGDEVAQRLGDSALCNIDQCWVRHQSPPTTRPHSWHQDGALGHTFSQPANADGGLLEMLTCWIALQTCGVDAPGLAWVTAPNPCLLEPSELTDAAVRSRHADSDIVAPALDAGDAFLFDGTLLHRTHVTPRMTRDRTSIELRFFRTVPARLAGQRFIAVQATGSKTST